MTKRTDAALEQRILALWAEGLSTSEVREKVSVSATTVRRVIERNGLELLDEGSVRKRNRITTREQDAEIARRYAAGESAVTLAKEYGFKFHLSVVQRVREAGVEVRPVGGPKHPLTDDEKAEILRLNRLGYSQERIAARIEGVGQGRISSFLREQGIRSWPLARHPRYSGGAVVMSNGYLGERLEPNDPYFVMCGRTGYVPQHRLVMARALGRPLSKSETVHHINGDRTDNRLENLQLRTGAHGKGVAMACLDCGSHRIGPVPI